MALLENIQDSKHDTIESNEDFWNWFTAHEKTFFEVIKNQDDIEKNFFNKLSEKLKELGDGYWFLTGMSDDRTAELIFTADGVIKNFVFIEELVAAAPIVEGWIFTALKPALDIKNVNIHMGDFEFNKDNMAFYSNDDPKHPDEINITIVHDELNDENRELITHGIYIFIDNLIGELTFLSVIDSIETCSKEQAEKELIPIEKLNAFLIWRQKEFIEKYTGKRYHTEKDSYSGFEATLENSQPLLAVINTSLLEWDSKASHPWITVIEIEYQGNETGMPDQATYELLDKIEAQIMLELIDYEGYLNVGRQTADGMREIFFACKEFRRPSRVLRKIQREYSDRFVFDYDIFKDKYWKLFDRFRT